MTTVVLHSPNHVQSSYHTAASSHLLTPIQSCMQESENNNEHFLQTPGSPHPRRHCVDGGVQHERFSFEPADVALNDDRLCLPNFDDIPITTIHDETKWMNPPALHLKARSITARRAQSPLSHNGNDIPQDNRVEALDLQRLFVS